MSSETTTAYDSRPDTWAHIEEVRSRLRCVINQLEQRALGHDVSKLVEPELSIFNEFTPKLRDSTYGSEEYEGFREAMGEGLRHHYEHNDHHPEHFDNGIHGMDLIQLIEMLCDWKAATMRHADGDLEKSIVQNRGRFGYGQEIENLLYTTAKNLGWV